MATQGLQLMLIGMGFVFIFLGLLVAIVSMMSRWLLSMQAPVAIQESVSQVAPQVSSDIMSDPELVSVITSAVHNYRKQLEDSRRG